MSQIPDISVIIPVYNVAPYIKECAESLFNQTLQSIEYIFIDDASSDESIRILEDVIAQYPKRVSQITIIRHKENKGTSFSRHEGTLMAKGNWIIHCDSDDYLEPDAYFSLIKLANESGADMIMCDYKRFSEDGRCQFIKHGEGVIEPIELLKRITGYSHQLWHGSLCNRIIKRELWQNVIFPEKISYCEDVLLLIQILLNNPEIKINRLSKSCYNYRIRPNSLITLKGKNRENEIISIINILEQLKTNENIIVHEAIDSKIVSLLYRLLNNSGQLEKLSLNYKPYKDKIKLNKELNLFKKLFLLTVLSEKFKLATFIRFGNQQGLNSIRICKKIMNKV